MYKTKGYSEMAERHDLLSKFIKDTWNIDPKGITEINEGSAKCFVIEAEKEKYFFKIYQGKFDRCTLENEIFVCSYLSKKGFAVSCFLESTNNSYIETFCDSLCTLQKYIVGTTVRKFEVSNEQLLDSVRVLAKLNVALSDLPIKLPIGFDQEWFTEWSAESVKKKYRDLLKKLDVTDEYYNRISEDFKIKHEMIEGFNPNLFDFSSLTVENSHGDYNVLQIIFEQDEVKAVIDFASCSKLPVCWEIIRSYTLSSQECRQGNIDIDNFISYVWEYVKIKKLSRSDLELMPYFYLFSLLRSTFGYRSYIEKKNKGISVNEKDMNALDFAFWRTSMCKWLFDHGDELSIKLRRIATR